MKFSLQIWPTPYHIISLFWIIISRIDFPRFLNTQQCIYYICRIIIKKEGANHKRKRNLKNSCLLLQIFGLCYGAQQVQKYAQRARKIKKVQAKKHVKSNKSKHFFSWNCIFGSFKLFASSKMDFWSFLKLQKMVFAFYMFFLKIWCNEIF